MAHAKPWQCWTCCPLQLACTKCFHTRRQHPGRMLGWEAGRWAIMQGLGAAGLRMAHRVSLCWRLAADVSQQVRCLLPKRLRSAQAHGCWPTRGPALAWPCAAPELLIRRHRSAAIWGPCSRCIACGLWLVARGCPCHACVRSMPAAKRRRERRLREPASPHQLDAVRLMQVAG